MGVSAGKLMTAVWEAAVYPWSVRLKALLGAWMPWIRQRFRPSAEVEKQLLKISARQVDRRLREAKRQKRRRIYGCTKAGLLSSDVPHRRSCDLDLSGLAGSIARHPRSGTSKPSLSNSP